MTKEEQKRKIVGRIDTSSKFWKLFLMVLAALLTFVGPTYFVYALVDVVKIGYAVSMVSGFALFVIGLVLIRYLIKNKIIS
jgi:hypothetical protein